MGTRLQQPTGYLYMGWQDQSVPVMQEFVHNFTSPCLPRNSTPKDIKDSQYSTKPYLCLAKKIQVQIFILLNYLDA